MRERAASRRCLTLFAPAFAADLALASIEAPLWRQECEHGAAAGGYRGGDPPVGVDDDAHGSAAHAESASGAVVRIQRYRRHEALGSVGLGVAGGHEQEGGRTARCV